MDTWVNLAPTASQNYDEKCSRLGKGLRALRSHDRSPFLGAAQSLLLSELEDRQIGKGVKSHATGFGEGKTAQTYGLLR